MDLCDGEQLRHQAASGQLLEAGTDGEAKAVIDNKLRRSGGVNRKYLNIADNVSTPRAMWRFSAIIPTPSRNVQQLKYADVKFSSGARGFPSSTNPCMLLHIKQNAYSMISGQAATMPHSENKGWVGAGLFVRQCCDRTSSSFSGGERQERRLRQGVHWHNRMYEDPARCVARVFRGNT